MNTTVPFTALAVRWWPTALNAATSAMSTGSPNRRNQNLRIAMNKWLHPADARPAGAGGPVRYLYLIEISALDTGN